MIHEYRLIPMGYAPDSRTYTNLEHAQREARQYRAPNGTAMRIAIERRTVSAWQPVPDGACVIEGS